jgi:hypothetical protein
MTIRSDLIRDIEIALRNSISATTRSRSAVADLFEAYIFSLAVEAARNEGAGVSYLDVYRNTPSSLVFRTSPGYISSTVQPYTYALIDFTGKPRLEAHIGVYVAGRSGVPHECDVAVLDSNEAETCRQNQGVLPRHSKVLLATECKFYTSGLTLGLGRNFLGLQSDISIKHGGRYFVTNTSSGTIEKLLTEHGKDWGHDIIPASINDVNKLRSSFQKKFEYYKARTF